MKNKLIINGSIYLMALFLPNSSIAQEAVPQPPIGSNTPLQTATPVLAEYRLFQKVEVQNSNDNGIWDSCIVTGIYKGAYEVSCNYTKTIRRDIHVRPLGGQPIATTAAISATEAPFSRDALVLASIMALPDHWQLCVVLQNQIQETQSYSLKCAGSEYNVGINWVRADSDEPR